MIIYSDFIVTGWDPIYQKHMGYLQAWRNIGIVLVSLGIIGLVPTGLSYLKRERIGDRRERGMVRRRMSFANIVGICFLLTATVLLLIAPLIFTSGWVFNEDGLCDACGSTAEYAVFEYNASREKSNEFCYFHAVLWSFFNPWRKGALTEGVIYLLVTYPLVWLGLSALFHLVINREHTFCMHALCCVESEKINTENPNY